MDLYLECKKSLFPRFVYAVGMGMLTQLLLLTVFLLFIDFNLLHPVLWISQTYNLVFSSYWIYIVPLFLAVLIYGMLLAKAQLTVKNYYPSRFEWFFGTILRRLGFFSIQLTVGYLTAWLYVRFLHVNYRDFFTKCFGVDCVSGRYTFLICAGMAAGFYHFAKSYLRNDPEIQFPIIQEVKLVKIRSLWFSTLYKSMRKSLVPTIVYTLGYALLGGMLNKGFARLFNVEIDNSFDGFFDITRDVRGIFYAWILFSQILSNMDLLQRLFSICLAEEMEFIIEEKRSLEVQPPQLTLVLALSMESIPVIQKLAALNFYHRSISKNPKRRQDLFALSLPGGHPYNWNQISTLCLCILQNFTDEFVSSIKKISTIKCAPLLNAKNTTSQQAAEKLLLRKYNENVGIRTLVPELEESSLSSNICEISRKTAAKRINERFDELSAYLKNFIRCKIRSIPGVNYLFSEAEDARTAFLLSNTHTIILIIQGLSGICAASLTEDKYGVVQEALPDIIKLLLQLKLELDKLNNVNLNGTKLDRNFINLKNAVKRSLYTICDHFGNYLHDIIVDPLELRHLHAFSNFQDT